MLDVLIEGKQLSVGGRVIGFKEGEVEVVLFDRDVENETNTAHAKLIIIFKKRVVCLRPL